MSTTYQGRGTGNILQDLLSSTVNLVRVTNYLPESQQVLSQDKLGQLVSTSVTLSDSSCSICGAWSENCQPLTSDEAQILTELGSCLLFTCTAPALCPNCSRTLEEVTKLKKRLLVITQCLRALLRIQRQKQSTLTYSVGESGIIWNSYNSYPTIPTSGEQISQSDWLQLFISSLSWWPGDKRTKFCWWRGSSLFVDRHSYISHIHN